MVLLLASLIPHVPQKFSQQNEAGPGGSPSSVEDDRNCPQLLMLGKMREVARDSAFRLSVRIER